MTSILATFKLFKPVAEDGLEVEPEISYISHGVLTFVMNFFCDNNLS